MPTVTDTPPTSPSFIGRDTPRVDGPLKVSGTAQYASDFHFPGHALCRARRSDDRERPRDRTRHGRRGEDARRSRDLSPRQHRKDLPLRPGAGVRRHRRRAPAAVRGRRRPLLRPVHRSGRRRYLRERQSRCRCGSRHVCARTSSTSTRRSWPTPSRTSSRPPSAPPSACRASAGIPTAPSRRRAVKLDQTYVTPTETHNPIELQATTAIWDGDDADHLRGVAGDLQPPRAFSRRCSACPRRTSGSSRSSSARVSAASSGPGRIARSPSPPRGTCRSRSSSSLSRRMMFQIGGPSAPHPAARAPRRHAGGPARLAAARLRQSPRRSLDDYHEDCGEATAFHYSVPNLRVAFGRARRNVGSPTAMRGPGAVPGLYATESAMNELADQLKIDPVRLRILERTEDR